MWLPVLQFLPLPSCHITRYTETSLVQSSLLPPIQHLHTLIRSPKPQSFPRLSSPSSQPFLTVLRLQFFQHPLDPLPDSLQYIDVSFVESRADASTPDVSHRCFVKKDHLPQPAGNTVPNPAQEATKPPLLHGHVASSCSPRGTLGTPGKSFLQSCFPAGHWCRKLDSVFSFAEPHKISARPFLQPAEDPASNFMRSMLW